jgi:DNA-binding CsgD family transcriptional regulator
MLAQIILLYRRAYPNRCFYCGTEMMHGLKRELPSKNIDHVIPRRKGGTNKAANRVPCCQPCNSAKKALFIHEFKEKRGGKPFFYETVIGKLMEYEQKLQIPGQGRVAPPTEADAISLGTRKNAIEILCAAAEGETNAEIAMRLGYSEQTVKNMWVVITERLGATNKLQAIIAALRSGIIKITEDSVVRGENAL